MGETRPFQQLVRGFAVAGSLGIGFAAAVALGLWLGVRCDRALGWRPVGCTLLFAVIGGAVGIRFIVRTLAALDRGERGGRGGPCDQR